MCPDDENPFVDNNNAWIPLGPHVNPFYNYLIELQEKRMRILEAVEPARHVHWQLSVTSLIILFWMLDHIARLAGFSIAVIILLAPLAIFGGLVLAGWKTQMLAVKTLPSLFEFPKALELVLSTPLTGREIVSATLRAHIRYPFSGLTLKRISLLALNIILMSLLLYESSTRGTLPYDVLDMSLKFYLPALCVFIYFPVLTGFDMLMVPSHWLKKSMSDVGMRSADLERAGMMPVAAMASVLIPVMMKINDVDGENLYNLNWIITTVCPVTLVAIPIAGLLLSLFLPGHLDKVRRSG